jgi:hypothetical protein
MYNRFGKVIVALFNSYIPEAGVVPDWLVSIECGNTNRFTAYPV